MELTAKSVADTEWPHPQRPAGGRERQVEPLRS